MVESDGDPDSNIDTNRLDASQKGQTKKKYSSCIGYGSLKGYRPSFYILTGRIHVQS